MANSTDDQLKDGDELPIEGEAPEIAIAKSEDLTQAPMSLEEMIESIDGNGDSEANSNLSPQATSIVIEIQRTYQNGKMDREYLEYAMGYIAQEEKLEALKALQSLIGESALRKAVCPTPRDLDNDLDALSPIITSDSLGVEGVAAYQMLTLLRLQQKLTPEALVESLRTIPTTEGKRALIANLADRLLATEYRDLIRGE